MASPTRLHNSITPNVQYVYVLYSNSDHGLYIGYTANLRRRLGEHQAGSAMATSYRGPWRLIYYEAYTEKLDALGREEFLKSGAGRTHLRKQCRHFFSMHPLRTTA
jgi:putative endonuclease